MKRWTDIEGWCDFAPLYWLNICNLPKGACFVELGSWMGQSMAAACQYAWATARDDIAFHAVDHWQGEADQPAHLEIVRAHGGSIHAAYRANLEAAGIAHMVTDHIGTTVERAADFPDASIDFLFIDAAHEYQPVCDDIRAYLPKLKPGAIIAGHDYPHPAVYDAVHATLIAEIGEWGRCWIYRVPGA